ncbi:fibronectin type III domain-containing protein, partial [Burkholderia sp. SIMBA_024]|uniref:fibronectin type III domain-containing protein n=1 Tax=Burkholderia sp. SIMBA_024 TaxID=3085768 RepID=UPI003978528E
MNAGAWLNWTPSTDASSYEVYQDGVKIMDVTSATATIQNLNNGSTYQFYVIAVNNIGKSNHSNIVTSSPTLNSVPNVTIPSNIGGIVLAISNWFGSIWLV